MVIKQADRIAFKYSFCLLFWHASVGNLISIDLDHSILWNVLPYF